MAIFSAISIIAERQLSAQEAKQSSDLRITLPVPKSEPNLRSSYEFPASDRANYVDGTQPEKNRTVSQEKRSA